MKKILFKALFLSVILTSCATSKTHSTQNTTQQLILKADPQFVYKTALQLAMEMSWVIRFSDESTLTFGGVTPREMSRWDDNVNVIIKEDSGEVTVIVKSQLGHKPNVEYIRSFLNRIELEVI